MTERASFIPARDVLVIDERLEPTPRFVDGFILILGLMTIPFLAVFVLWPSVLSPDWLWPGLLIAALVAGVLTATLQRLARRGLVSTARAALEQGSGTDVASRARLRALAARSAQPVDPRTLIDAAGPEGPRTVCLHEVRHLVGDATPSCANDESAEEIEVGVGSGTSKHERRVLSVMAVFVGLWLLATVASPSGAHGWLAPLGPGVILVGLLARLGLRPVRLGAVIASRGQVSALRWVRERVFTRRDSVLVLTGPVRAGQPASVITALLCRVDGVMFELDFPDGADNPRLQALCARWCWRAEALGRTGPTMQESSGPSRGIPTTSPSDAGGAARPGQVC